MTRTYRRQWREWKFGVRVDLPVEFELVVLEVFGSRCAACGSTERLGLDHHRPLREGYSLLHNAVPLCVKCNRRKGNKAPRTFYDGWKLAEVVVGLYEVRERFEKRFPSTAPAAPEVA